MRAHSQQHLPEAALAVAVVDGLDELPSVLRRIGEAGPAPDRSRLTGATGNEG